MSYPITNLLDTVTLFKVELMRVGFSSEGFPRKLKQG